MECVIQGKADAFAVRIVNLCRFLQKKNEMIMSKQILRSGTSVGANVAEAQYAASKADFINKYQIALKEANETDYWLRLLSNTGYLPDDESSRSLVSDCKELLRLLIASTRTAKKRI